MRFIGEVLKHILWIISITMLCAIAIFFINTSISDRYEDIAISVLFIVVLFVAIIGLIGLIKGNIKILKIKDRLSSFFLLMTSIICFFTVLTLIIFNSTFNETIAALYNQDSITISEKIDALYVIIQNTKSEHKTKQSIVHMETKNYKHIIFYYFPEDRDTDEDLIDKLIGEIAALDKRINSIIPTKYSQPLEVILYNNADKYRSATNTPKGMLRMGVYHNGIIDLVNVRAGGQMVGQGNFSIQNVEDIFIHEYFHYKWNAYLIEHKLDAAHIPRWFEEGLASYFPYALQDAFPILEFKNFDIKLNDLATFDQWENHANSAIYDYAYMAIYYLIDINGEDVVHNILNLLEEGISFDIAFKTKTGLSVEEFESKLLP